MSTDSKRGADEGQIEPDAHDLFEEAPCGYLLLELDGAISLVNKRFADWLERDPFTLVGEKFQSLLTFGSRVFYETHFSPLLRLQGSFYEVALDFSRQDREALPVLANAIEKRSADGRPLYILVSVFNATDRRRYERELVNARAQASETADKLKELNTSLEERIAAAVAETRRAEAALRQSQKMEALGQLTGGIAHDFNNLLTVIIGGIASISRSLAKMPEDPELPRVKRFAEMALQSARRSARLTSRLLAFSRQQMLAPAALDARKLISGMEDLLNRSLGPDIRLEVEHSAGLWNALADQGELENVLLNFALNARDAMPEGGHFSIETSNAILDERYVRSLEDVVMPGEYVMIAVSDTGTGMDPGTIAKAFEPFFTTKESGRGTGLGLSQAYGFARQSGGHIRIHSELGQGTTIKLYLPKATGSTKSETPAITQDKPPVGGSETILVVEDDPVLRAFSVDILRELGYHVLAAANGEEAVSILGRNATVDLLFTDVILPGGYDGRLLADTALVIRADLKVLFTTGYTRNATVHNAMLDERARVLGKPYSYEELASRVRELLDNVDD